jgi:hypothetical protein
MSQVAQQSVGDKAAIRPFQVLDVLEANLTDLRRRITEAVWPERETVADRSQGVKLDTMHAFARYGPAITTGASARRLCRASRSS